VDFEFGWEVQEVGEGGRMEGGKSADVAARG
jgi:hypothetical protein